MCCKITSILENILSKNERQKVKLLNFYFSDSNCCTKFNANILKYHTEDIMDTKF